jgi:hypothetical protein
MRHLSALTSANKRTIRNDTNEDDMAHSVYGFSRQCFATGVYLEGPRTLESALTIEAKVVMATAIYVLSDKPKGEFLMAASRPSDCNAAVGDIINYCVFAAGLEHQEKSCPWFTEAPEERAACVESLFEGYREQAFCWYRRPAGCYGASAPIHVGLQAFVLHHKNVGVWSLGQTLDMAILFRTLVDFFDGWEREDAQHIADELRPYALAFERFSAEGCYAIKVDDVPADA